MSSFEFDRYTTIFELRSFQIWLIWRLIMSGMFKKRDRVVSSDDDDTISLTSTQDSEHSENHEFAVDCILAEKKEKGIVRYLLKWTDYPIQRASWEPEDSIVDLSMLREWKKRKSREANSLDGPFDIKGYEAKVARLRREKKSRVARRQAKRDRLGYTGHDPKTRQCDPDDEAVEVDRVAEGPDGKKTIGQNSVSQQSQKVAYTTRNGRDDDTTELRQATGQETSALRSPHTGQGSIATVSVLDCWLLFKVSRDYLNFYTDIK
jgi:hypothetical protein